MGEFMHKYTSGEPKQKNRQDILDLFNHMNLDDAIKQIEIGDENVSEVVWVARKIVCNRDGKNPHTQLQAFRKYVPKLIDAIAFYEAVADYSFEQIDRLMSGIDVNKNKRWEKEDEEALIEMVCADVNDVEIAVRFGRSVTAIKTKVSQLVGIGRIDQKVAGRFVGTINGEAVDGMAKGTLYKEA